MSPTNTEMTHCYSMRGMAFEVIEQGTIRLGGTAVYTPGAVLGMADELAITTLEQRNGHWVRHPIESKLRQGDTPLRVIPISIPYDDPDLVIQSRLTAFDSDTKRIVCRATGTGCARRRVEDQVTDVECSGPESCRFAQQSSVECKWFGRLRVHIGEEESFDPTRVFVLRSAGQHTLRGVEAALRQYRELFGGLRGIPMQLAMSSGTTAASDWQRFEFVGLSLREGVSPLAAIEGSKTLKQKEAAIGLNFGALEQAVRAGLDNSEFARNSLEGLLASEFFPVEEAPTAAVERPAPRAALSFMDIGLAAGLGMQRSPS